MRIKELFIDVFGIYTNFQLDFNLKSSPFTIIYGPNEAGKSTLHAFLRYMLFGHQERGKPGYDFAQGKLSGRLTLLDETDQLFYLERSTPPKQGKIRLFDEQGTELGATTLARLLGHVSAPLFTNIFAFGHQELERLDTLQGEEVEAFLYSAALGSGANQLVDLEKKMAKESDLLFRPRATNPPINQLVKETEAAQLQVEKLQDQFTTYTTVRHSLAQLHQQLAALHKERERLAEKRKLYEKKAKLIEQEETLFQLEQERSKLEHLPRPLLKERDYFVSLLYQEESMKEMEKNIQRIEEKLESEHEQLKDYRRQEKEMQRGLDALRRKLNSEKRLTVLGLLASFLLPASVFWWVERPLVSVLLFIGLLWLTKAQYARWKKDEQKEAFLSQQWIQLRMELEQGLSRVDELEEQKNRDTQAWEHWQTEVLLLAAKHAGERMEDPYLAIKKLRDQLAREEQIEEELRSLRVKEKQLVEELRSLRQSLLGEQLSPEDKKRMEELTQENIGEQVIELEHRYAAVLEEIERVAKACGQQETELKLLANEDELSRALQILEEKKAELEGKARKWATFALAGYLCQKVRHLYEVERQPEVLKRASRFFETMTLGRYKKIIVPFSEKTIQVIRSDNRRLQVEELSRGTREQLYLAMRYAVVQDYEKVVSLPLIMDDVFVHFDRKRVKEALAGLAELAKKHQIIYFTCHEHLLQLMEEVLGKVNIVELNGAKKI